MKLHYSLLILALANAVLHCNDNNNNNAPKKLAIVEVFNKLAAKTTLTKAEKAKYKATKTELRNILSQDFAAAAHAQIENALANDLHKTPENSPIKVQSKAIRKIQEQISKVDKENIAPINNRPVKTRFGLVQTIPGYGEDTAPNTIQLDIMCKNITTQYYASAQKELVEKGILDRKTKKLSKTNNNNI